MRKISGTYPDKKGNSITFNIDVPATWNELSAYQAANILQVLTYNKAGKFLMSVSLLTLLFDKNWQILSHLNDEQLHGLVELTNFLVETQPEAKNKFSKLKINKKECHAPAEDLNNLGFGEWCFAYQAHQYYSITRDKMYLDKLIAVLYRPMDPDHDPESVNYTGDIRQIFNENLILPREKAVADIEFRIKQAVLAWFSAALYNVMAAREHVFPKTDEETEDREPEEKNPNRTWFSVFRELLGPKWGTEDKLKHTNAMFVLDALEEQQIELKST
jgi:hypothetical protein